MVSAGVMVALGGALLPAQQQPRAVIDLERVLETRYEDTRPWWDPARGAPLAASKEWEDASGRFRLLNKSGEVETKDHPFFTPLGSNGRSCVTCHQPTSAMSLSLDLIRFRCRTRCRPAVAPPSAARYLQIVLRWSSMAAARPSSGRRVQMVFPRVPASNAK